MIKFFGDNFLETSSDLHTDIALLPFINCELSALYAGAVKSVFECIQMCVCVCPSRETIQVTHGHFGSLEEEDVWL